MRNMINLHTIRDDSLLGTLKFVFKTQDYQQYGALIPDDMINQDIKDSKIYKTYDFATGKVPPKKARKYKKVASPLRKLSPVLEEEPTEKPKKAKKPAKKSTTVPIAGVVIRDTPGVLVSKKKAPAKGDRGKGIELLSDAALLDSHMLCASGSDVPKYLSESENESWGDSGDDGSNDDDSDDVTKNDDEDDNDDEEEEHEEEYIRTPDRFGFNDDDEEYDELYKDVNMRSKVTEHEEVGKGDAEMTDTTHESASQENSYKQVIEDAHVTPTSSQKTEGSKQSSSVSSDFASKFLNLDNVPPVIDEVASMMNVKTPHEESSTQAPPNLSIHVTAIPETSTVHVTTVTLIIQPFSSIPQMTTSTPVPTTEPTTSSILALPDFASLFGFNQRVSALEQELYQAAASLTKFELKKIMLDKLEKSKSYRAAEQHRDLYDALVKSYQVDKDLFDSYGKVYSLKRGHEDKDKDEDPPAGSDQGLKKRNTSKDVEPPKGSKSKENKSNSSKGSKSQSKSSGKSAQVEDPVFETVDTEMP
ncbi:hypothetical protein Tco_1190456 [Tanacetum coccineum]